MNKVIYIKKVYEYGDIIKNIKLPIFIKKIIFLFKNIFSIVTEKEENGFLILILPFKEKVLDNKFKKIICKNINKQKINKEIKLVISKDIMSEQIENILEEYDVSYFSGDLLKKMLIFKMLEFINKLQRKQVDTRKIAILCNEDNELNKFIIKKLAIENKSIKIISSNIYKFQNLEKELYNDYGIAIQFSNSYKKSLLNSEIIINLDFDEIQINEYNINLKAIIINMINKIRIKTKTFQGVVINSCEIKVSKELKKNLLNHGLLNRFEMLVLYESLIDWNKQEYEEILMNFDKNNLNIVNLIGNNGIIDKKEFKIISKSIDKS